MLRVLFAIFANHLNNKQQTTNMAKKPDIATASTEETLTVEQRLEKLETAHLELVGRFEFHRHGRVGELELYDPATLAANAEKEKEKEKEEPKSEGGE